MPVASLARTKARYVLSKSLGYLAKAIEKSSPPSTAACNSRSTRRSDRFFSCDWIPFKAAEEA